MRRNSAEGQFSKTFENQTINDFGDELRVFEPYLRLLGALGGFVGEGVLESSQEGLGRGFG